MDEESMRNILNRRMNKHGLAKQLDSYKTIGIADLAIKPFGRAVSVSHGILTVECEDTIIAQELQFQAHTLIKQINQKLGQSVIRKISYRIKPNSEQNPN